MHTFRFAKLTFRACSTPQVVFSLFKFVFFGYIRDNLLLRAESSFKPGLLREILSGLELLPGLRQEAVPLLLLQPLLPLVKLPVLLLLLRQLQVSCSSSCLLKDAHVACCSVPLMLPPALDSELTMLGTGTML